MGIQEVYRCNRCGSTTIDRQDARQNWFLIYRVPPCFAPSYSITMPMLCPKCDKDLEKWLGGQGLIE